MALYLTKGRYVFLLAIDGRKIKIKSKAKYNDGQWHTVSMTSVKEFSSLLTYDST